MPAGGRTSNGSATVEFAGSDATGVRFTCTLSVSEPAALQPQVFTTAANLSAQLVALGQPFNCTSPLALRWLLPGDWRLEVVGWDAAGNAAPPLELSWTVGLNEPLNTRFVRWAGQQVVGRAAGVEEGAAAQLLVASHPAACRPSL